MKIGNSKATQEKKLFGQPKWEVENLADTIMKSREAERPTPELFKAAVKLLERRQSAIAGVLKSVIGKRKSNG
ncbi:MAG: hypothetical protein ACYTEX_23180 [Planctomycetota bacterium]|jgi:hypothetical protein